MSQTYHIRVLSEAVSPITHMSGTSGNEGIIAREPVMTGKGKIFVPYLSGNSLRHRCIRQPGVKWLVSLYGLHGVLTLPLLNFLYHGGNLTESNSHENTQRIAAMRHAWPLLSVLGGSLPNQILAGKLQAHRGILVCEENRQTLSLELGESLPVKRLRPAEEFIGNQQYTRGDAVKTGESADTDDEERLSNLMIFSGQTVARGAIFVHGFTLPHATPIELGAVILSLRLWQHAEGGTIGGSAARGHGRLKSSIVGDSHDEAVAAYIDHAQAVKQDALDWLRGAFEKKEKEKAPKSKKAKAGA